MTNPLRKVFPSCVFGGLILLLTTGITPAQPVAPQSEPLPLLPPPAQAQQPNGVEVLARGPVHEAYATTAEAPAATPIVTKQPPDPIEELPPDQKPEGDNVQWIPGYWHWDEESSKFIWISGFWRQPPPGRLWVPGSWREARGGWQWVPGFWQEPNPQQPQQPEIEYLPQPPESVEIGPTVPAPDASHFYVPGSWVYRNKYVWRPGCWVGHRADWSWVPACYRWSPTGYVFVEGYWDYPLADRGVLFAPVAFSQPIYTEPSFMYTPSYIVSEPCMVGALFVRRGWGCYYFGDYFEPWYANRGYSPWCGTLGRNGFSLGFGVGRSWGYDPLWSHYSTAHRTSAGWDTDFGNLYQGRYSGSIARPPVTLVQQNTVINQITNVRNVTNVTDNLTVVNKNVTVNNKNITNVAMVAPLGLASQLQQRKYGAVTAAARRSEATIANQIRDVGVQRKRLEMGLANQAGPSVTAQPQRLKLDLPKTVVARPQLALGEPKQPPPSPHKNLNRGGQAELPKFEPKRESRPLIVPNPVISPQVDPKPQPKLAPQSPVKPVESPKFELPKVEPKVLPKVTPVLQRIDPKPAIPAANLAPRVNPNPHRQAAPGVVANPVATPKQVPLPRVEPKPVVNAPAINPRKAELPRVAPVEQPKPENIVPRIEPRPGYNLPKVQQPPAQQPALNLRPAFKPPVIQPKPQPPGSAPKFAAPVQPRAAFTPPPVQKPRVDARVTQPRPQPQATKPAPTKNNKPENPRKKP